MNDKSRRDIAKADVVFTEATPDQRLLTWRINGESWAEPMSIDTYVRRETRLSETELSANGGCKYVVLHRRGDPEDIVSSCEVTRKVALVSDATGSRRAASYSIASVFTNPLYRERGMGSLLLRKVQELMDVDSECSALYSDIGTVYYAKLGWPVYPSLQVSLCLLGGAGETKSPTGIRYLTRNEALVLCEKDVAALTEKFAALGKDGKTHITFLPSKEQMDWHFTRDGFMATALHGREVVHRGATTEDGKSWMYWDHDFREKKLKVLRIVADGTESITALLQAAVVEAAGWGLAKVLVWNPNEPVSAAARVAGDASRGGLDIIFDERLDGSIPSLRWKGGKDIETVWEDNDYYSWC